MTLKDKPLAKLTEEVIQILYRELGTVNTVRFLRQFSTGLGNYTVERAARAEEETLDQLLDEIRQRRDDQELSDSVGESVGADDRSGRWSRQAVVVPDGVGE